MKLFLFGWTKGKQYIYNESEVRGKIQKIVEICGFNTPYKILFDDTAMGTNDVPMVAVFLEISDELPTQILTEWKIMSLTLNEGIFWRNDFEDRHK